MKIEQAQINKIKLVLPQKLLEQMGFSLQINQKMNQIGSESPDRDAQFKHINETVKIYSSNGNPVISVDCKKKENIGNFKNNGAEYAPKKNQVKVLDHDFPLPENGKAVPYGVYDITIEVLHFPPGTSKWNKIEHRLFSQISKNWRGKPLETLSVIINLISSTTTDTGLKVKYTLDTNQYPSGIKVEDEELEGINITRNCFHGEWNYVISPRNNHN